mgnify:CR=1 FL=1|tara:strand:- start:1230 stop:1439 length:210 start_codon:yes stop_codon:yes gene_type:complete
MYTPEFIKANCQLMGRGWVVSINGKSSEACDLYAGDQFIIGVQSDLVSLFPLANVLRIEVDVEVSAEKG